MNIIKQLFCKHNFVFIRNLHGDEINQHNGKRSLWQCTRCGKQIYMNRPLIVEKKKEEKEYVDKYVDNEVFKFSCTLKWELSDYDEYVYTRPFPDILMHDDEAAFDKHCEEEMLVESKYFTKQKIEELKAMFIKRIQESENPFNICCVDRDGNYNVTEDELFDIDN